MNLSKYAPYFTTTYTDDVYLFEPDSTKDSTYGSVEEGWKTPTHATGNVQAYSGDLAFKEYGIEKSCEKRVFLPPDTIVSEGWGISFTSTATKPELFVKYAPQNKTHRFILAGTR